ncbi:MAG: DUF3618 domain-containing protein [Mangrovicoccus sp.]
MSKSRKTTDQIEAEIAVQREALARTLSALAGQVSLDHLLGDVAGNLQSYGKVAGQKLGRAARENPAGLALAGAGLALAAYGASRMMKTGADDKSTMAALLKAEFSRPDISEEDRVSLASYLAELEDRQAGAEPRLAEERLDAVAQDPWGTIGDDLADVAPAEMVEDELERLADQAQEEFERGKDRSEELSAKIYDGMQDLGTEAQMRVLQARLKALEAQIAIERKAKQAAEKTKTVYQEKPLWFGLGAAALGAVVAAALPKRKKPKTPKTQPEPESLMAAAQRVLKAEQARAMQAARSVKGAKPKYANGHA